MPIFDHIFKWKSIHGCFDFEQTSWQLNQGGFVNLFLSLDLIKNNIGKQHSSSTLPKTMTIEIFTNLIYSNSCYFRKAIEPRLDHNVITGLHLNGGSKTCLLFAWIVKLKRDVPIPSFCSFSRASAFKS